MALTVKAKESCRWDLVSLGEVMLRFDPGDHRIWTTRMFEVSEGGGEYNVARGLKRCFGLDTAVVTAIADNPVGRLLQDLIYQGGVDQSLVRWVDYDGVGRGVRNGLNFTERGFGVRPALGCSDRGHTAVSQLKAGDIDWDEIFGKHGARWAWWIFLGPFVIAVNVFLLTAGLSAWFSYWVYWAVVAAGKWADRTVGRLVRQRMRAAEARPWPEPPEA